MSYPVEFEDLFNWGLSPIIANEVHAAPEVVSLRPSVSLLNSGKAFQRARQKVNKFSPLWAGGLEVSVVTGQMCSNRRYKMPLSPFV